MNNFFCVIYYCFYYSTKIIQVYMFTKLFTKNKYKMYIFLKYKRLLKNKIPIVRVIWGENPHTMNEIFQKPIFEDETVFVWGIENQKYLKKLGYKTYLMSEHISHPEYSTRLLQYLHKVKVISEANKQFDEFILLDWDCYLVKPLDETFYNILRSGNDVQMPLYCFEDLSYLGFLKDKNPLDRYQVNWSDDMLEYFSSIEKGIRQYSWKLNNLLVSPNFGFFYTRNKTIGDELLNLIEFYDVNGIADEHIFYIFTNCTIEEYLNKYEPNVTFGRSVDIYQMDFNEDTDFLSKFHEYIESMVDKNIYFKHV